MLLRESPENDKIVSEFIRDKIAEEMNFKQNFAEELVESLDTKIVIGGKSE